VRRAVRVVVRVGLCVSGNGNLVRLGKDDDGSPTSV
jgi:hypothetical protein